MRKRKKQLSLFKKVRKIKRSFGTYNQTKSQRNQASLEGYNVGKIFKDKNPYLKGGGFSFYIYE